jgi:hypothetical protein
MIFRLNTGRLIEIKQNSFINNTEYYAKIIKIRFNKILSSDDVTEDDIISLLK